MIPGVLIESALIEHPGQVIMNRGVLRGHVVDVFRGPVVCFSRGAIFLPDADKLDNSIVRFSVREHQRDRIGLDLEPLLIEMLGFFLVASRSACDRAGAVETLLPCIPDPVAGPVHGHRAIALEIQNTAFNRIDNTGQIVLSGQLIQKRPHLFHRVRFSVHKLLLSGFVWGPSPSLTALFFRPVCSRT